MFRYNPKANYQPNGGRYLQMLSGKDLYKQTIVMSARTHDTFPARFVNIFVDYPLGQMRVGDKLWMNWNKAPMHLWQTQLNFAVWCTSSACEVSSAHLNYTKHPMIRSVYRFHIYYVHVPNFGGLSGSEDRGRGDNSIQFINFGKVGDKSLEKWRQKMGGWKGG